MNKRFLCTILIASALTAAAQQADSLTAASPKGEPHLPAASLEHHSLFATTVDGWMQNPAMRYDAFVTTYGQFMAYVDRRHEHEAYVMQEGNSLRNSGLEASSYRRLGSAATVPSVSATVPDGSPSGTVVWGEASYQAGHRDHVEWNASSDWATIYPYVFADTLGGDRKTERYTFRGGSATRLGGWTIGEDLTFRAEHEWSTSDPRMRGIVTDLKARLGVSRRLLGHQLAAGGTVKLYKQTNSVEFYREEGVVPEYQMSGLGNWYSRFSGTNNSAYYKATGWGGDVALQPARGRRGGLLLTANYGYTPYRRILSSLNAMPIQKLYVTEWSALAGWRQLLGPTESAVWVGHSGSHRRGDEIIGGQSTASEYVERGNLTMYKNRLTDIHAGVMVALSASSSSTLQLLVKGGRQRYGSRYAFPGSAFDFKKNYVSSRLQWQMAGRRYMLSTDVACDYYHQLGGGQLTTGAWPLSTAADEESDAGYTSSLTADVAQARELMIERCVAQALASYTQWSVGAHAQWQPLFMGSFGMFAEVRAACLRNDVCGSNKGFLLHTAVGVTF